MRTRHSSTLLNITDARAARRPDRARGGAPPPQAKQVILLVSDDTAVAENLRRAAEQTGRSVVRAGDLDETLRTVRMTQPAAVVLDLDLPSSGAWDIADRLLQEAACPPVVLLTGRRGQFDVGTAIRAGSLVDKSACVTSLLEVVDQALALPAANRAERNAIQRIVIQWLRPCAWAVPVTPAQRFWGINE
jgi:DNA-binding response OmpR family regulator